MITEKGKRNLARGEEGYIYSAMLGVQSQSAVCVVVIQQKEPRIQARLFAESTQGRLGPCE